LGRGKALRARRPKGGEACSGGRPRYGVAGREGRPQEDLDGMRDSIERSLGVPDRPALNVRLEHGRRGLFWLHRSERAEEA